MGRCEITSLSPSFQISHAMLMPSDDFRDSESVDFQVNFVVCGGLKLLLSFLTDKTLLADAGNVMKRSVCTAEDTVHVVMPTLCRSAMMTIMKMLKLLLMASAYGCIVHVVQDMKNKQVRSPGIHCNSTFYGRPHNPRFLMRDTRQPWSCRLLCRTSFQ